MTKLETAFLEFAKIAMGETSRHGSHPNVYRPGGRASAVQGRSNVDPSLHCGRDFGVAMATPSMNPPCSIRICFTFRTKFSGDDGVPCTTVIFVVKADHSTTEMKRGNHGDRQATTGCAMLPSSSTNNSYKSNPRVLEFECQFSVVEGGVLCSSQSIPRFPRL